MSLDARVRAWLALHLAEGIGPRTVHALLRQFGSAEAVVAASPAALARELPERLVRALKTGPGADQLALTEAWLGNPDNHFLAWDDPLYPPQLLTIADPPPVLYAKGRLEVLSRPAVAIVGSRNASPLGLQTAEAFAKALSEAGVTVVSGLALGIDAAAHKGALQGEGSTIAVVGTGLDRIYPRRNHDLARAMVEAGALISEFPLGTPPLATNFPRRNRIISGLARGCLVVEATLASGSLITARLAGEQGREVFAIPGSIHSPFAKGCHKLIREGAKLVETAQDILEELQLSVPLPAPAIQSEAGNPTASDSARVIAAIGFDTADLDTLCARTGFAIDRILSLLLELELAGHIAVLPGGRYQRLG